MTIAEELRGYAQAYAAGHRECPDMPDLAERAATEIERMQAIEERLKHAMCHGDEARSLREDGDSVVRWQDQNGVFVSDTARAFLAFILGGDATRSSKP